MRAAAIDFYVKAFDAVELGRVPGPDGKLIHAALQINGIDGAAQRRLPRDATTASRSTPIALGGTPVTIHLDRHRCRQRSSSRPSTPAPPSSHPLEDQFWGDRYGVAADPFGHQWSMGQPVREVSMEEIEEAVKAAPIASGRSGQSTFNAADRPAAACRMGGAGAVAAAASMSAIAVNLSRGRSSPPRAISAASIAFQPVARRPPRAGGCAPACPVRRACAAGSASRPCVVVGDQVVHGLRRTRLVGADEAGRATLDPACDIAAAHRRTRCRVDDTAAVVRHHRGGLVERQTTNRLAAVAN